MFEKLQILAYIRTFFTRLSIKDVAQEIGVLYGYVQHSHAGDSIHRLEFLAWFNIKLSIIFFELMNQSSLTMVL
jgi:hypothetical protein